MSLALRLAAAASAVAAASAAPAVDPSALSEALAADDQCSAGDAACALNAIQLKRQRTSVEANATGGGLCLWFGCNAFVVGQSCQCNSKCSTYGNCCPGYEETCNGAKAVDPCYGKPIDFTLDWKAEGSTFFKDWTFVTQDDVHGAHQFVNKSEALARGVIEAELHDAFIRVGDIRQPVLEDEALKRYSVNLHTSKAWDPQEGMLIMMKYKHLPNGCGLWPGFWTMNSDKVWPGGGEMDIMEYANREGNLVSVHVAEHCHLDKAKIDQCKPSGSDKSSQTATQDCATDYYKNLMGCRPPHKRMTGWQLSSSPGIIAAEWTKEHVIVYHIPEGEIPEDVHNNHPQPSTWNKWILAFLPFEKPCMSLGPQELVLNLQLCGDWAGNSWFGSSCGSIPGDSPGLCKAGLSEKKDCCTQYITSSSRDGDLKKNGYFDINYVKVFTANGAKSKPSGIYMREGAMLS